MRRSRSLSNIPMPCNAKRDSKAKRTKSTMRNSRDPSLDGQTPLAYRLGSHTPLGYRLGAELSDQKYKSQKNFTPTTYNGFKRSGSVSSFGSRISISKNRSPLEKKSMQKLLNDKKWVADQYSKVQAFIQTSGLFNPELSGMIRPPTINTVVELFTGLFRHLIKTDIINSQSYGDVALRTLKLLNYPGTLTLSTLKTVNTMHGWPHFIAIISWLIERVDIISFSNGFREQQEEDIKRMFSLQDSVLEFLTTLHCISADGGGTIDQDLLIQSEDKLYEDMSALTGSDPDAVKNLEQPIEICRAEVNELETKLQEITEENHKIQAQNLERQQIIKNFKESNSTREQDLETELLQLRKLRQKQIEKKKNLISSVKELEYVVASQSCRYNEKNKILSQIEDLKRAIGRKERKLTEYRAVRDQLDHELTNMVKEIESKVDAWNVSLTKTLLPEMQHLRLREKGFHSKNFIEELREVLKEQVEITKQLQQEYQTIKSNIEKLQKKRESLVENNKALNAIKENLDSLKKSIQSIKEEKRSILSETADVKKQFDTDIMEIEHLEGNKIKQTETQMAELYDRIQKLTEKMDKSAKKGIGVLVEAHNMAMQNMKRIDEARHSMSKDVTIKAEQSKHNLIDTFNYLLSIQEKTASMLEGFNEDNKENITRN